MKKGTNENKIFKLSSKGITLVSLVITIIILLIIASAGIAIAINSDGLFGKANTAVQNWNTAVEEEIREGQELLKDLVTTSFPATWETEKVEDIVIETVTIGEEKKVRKAPIPAGYVASQIPTEDTISEGLVIYQGKDPVTGEANSTEHITAMTTRNQFVWIPVDDIDYMVMCKSNASGSVCDLELEKDEEGNYSLRCKTHNAEGDNTTDLCGRIYSTSSSNSPVTEGTVHTYLQTFDETQWSKQKWSTSGYREPDIVSKVDIDSNTNYLTAAGVSTATELKNQLKNDFVAMATSIAKYGGFYVSRYEAEENGASLKSQEVLVTGDTTLAGHDTDTFKNGNLWYGMYNVLRTSTAINKTAVSSHMIWGSQYDMIIKFLKENSLNEPEVGHVTRQLEKQEKTGETLSDIMSNIYDLEGNNYEITALAYSTGSRAIRGSCVYYVANNSAFVPASYNSNVSAKVDYCLYTSRSVLYL